MKKMISLEERSVQAIKSFRVPNSAENLSPDEVEELWRIQYEIEYKFSMIQGKGFIGTPQRKDNILRILMDKGQGVNEMLQSTLLDVYEEWLQGHALTDPKQWAESRVEALIEIGSIAELSSDLSMTYYEFTQKRLSDTLMEKIDELPEFKQAFADLYWNDYLSSVIDDIENGEGSPYGEMNDPDDEDEQEEEIERIQNLPIDEVVDGHTLLEFYENLNQMRLPTDLELDIHKEVYAVILFPLWYKHWSAKGIDATRDRIEKVTKDLRRMDKLPLNKQFMVLNIAKNAAHQTGSMMDYYEEKWGVDYRFFEDLTKKSPVKEWNAELEEIGVVD